MYTTTDSVRSNTGPEFSTYHSYSSRLHSFRTWRGSQNIHEMALAGFFYLQEGDDVRCFHCGIQIHLWEPHDSPVEEHLRHAPSCRHAITVAKWFDAKRTVHSIVKSLDSATTILKECQELLRTVDHLFRT